MLSSLHEPLFGSNESTTMRTLLPALVCANALCVSHCAPYAETFATGEIVGTHASHGDEARAAEHHDDDHDDDHDHDAHEHHHAHIVLTPEMRRDAARVLVLQSTHTDRVSEVVGVVDVHADSGDQDEALDELRAEALAMGADAVLGVEFHHGETHHAPTHLSGLAVRFLGGPTVTGRY